jgi:hypothetical protein
MTFTSDPPVVGDITLIPGVDEKADLDAPSGSGGKLVIGQAPNITITETTVVADAAERLALDVQEGDIAIQTNTSQSFIFTGGPNIAPNWQVIDFDAVGAIAGEDISPSNVTASGDVSASGDIDGATLSGADIANASVGQLLTSDGSGGLQFASPAGGVPTGGIIMWSGAIANIPSGFALCDGSNGTPDLTDRFVVGAGGSEYSVDDTGGQKEVQLTIAEMPSHNHTERAFGAGGFGSLAGAATSGANNIEEVDNTGGDQPHENRPPYYALAYIMKT